MSMMNHCAGEYFQTGQLLLALLRRQLTTAARTQLRTLPEAAWQQLTELATDHLAASLLWTRLQQHELEPLVPVAVQARLEQAQYQTALCNLRFYHQLHQLLDLAEAQEIPILMLKGAHLAATIYPTIDQRAMTDLDLLVQQAHIPVVIPMLLEQGYTPATSLHDYTAHLISGAHHLPRFIKPDAPSIELHWKLTHANDTHHLPVDNFWQRAETFSLQHRRVLGLAAEDLLLHVCLHAMHRHLLRQGVRFLCDIDAIVHHAARQTTLNGEARPLDWSAMIERAKAIGAERAVYLALRMAQQLLDTPIPSSVLAALYDSEIDDATWQTVVAQLFVEERPYLRAISPNYIRGQTHMHWLDQLRYFWQRLWITRQQLALRYAVDTHSRWLPFYYLRRLHDLTIRHYVTRHRIARQHPAIQHVATQQITLLRWLEG